MKDFEKEIVFKVCRNTDISTVYLIRGKDFLPKQIFLCRTHYALHIHKLLLQRNLSGLTNFPAR